MKTCSSCDAEHYAKGLCYKHYRRIWRADHKDSLNAKQRDYSKNNPDKAKSAEQAWKAKNPNYSAEYHQKNKVKRLAQIAKWCSENIEKKRAYTTNRRALLRGASGSHTAEEIKNLLVLQNGCCATCKTKLPKNYHKDHIVPLVSGGHNSIGNIQLLCPLCNSSKCAKDPITFMQQRGFLL